MSGATRARTTVAGGNLVPGRGVIGAMGCILRPAAIAALMSGLLLAGCSLLDLEPDSPECRDHPQPQRCEQALAAVVAELTEQGTPIDGSLRIEPVQCAHGRCWTWAYLTSTDGRGELTMGVDWMPNGEVSVSFVVP